MCNSKPAYIRLGLFRAKRLASVDCYGNGFFKFSLFKPLKATNSDEGVGEGKSDGEEKDDEEEEDGAGGEEDSKESGRANPSILT